MLEEQDLLAIQSIVEGSITNVKESITNVEESVANVEGSVANVKEYITNVEESMDRRITQSENLILNYVDDTRKTLEKQIQQVQKNLDELAQYYRLTKLENDNTSLLLKMVEEFYPTIPQQVSPQ